MEEKNMMEMNLQLFGGNGASGTSLSNGSGQSINIKDETDVWSYRHNKNNEPFVDSINESVRTIQNDFPGIMDTVQTVSASELGGADKNNVLGYYGQGGLGMNVNYTDPEKMNKVYDHSVAEGFHPSRGNKNGTEAVALHEMGHAVTDHVAQKMGVSGLDAAANKIVKDAYKASGQKGGNKKFASKISGYATQNYAECVAEAVADWYCNGNRASSASKYIMSELKKYS